MSQPYDPHQQQPYQLKPYDPQPYPPYPVSGGQGMYAPVPQERPGTLGLVGVGLVGVSALVLMVLAWILGGDLADLVVDVGGDRTVSQGTVTSDPRFEQYIATSMVQWTVVQLACLAGLVGWVISIVATASRRGRAAGIWGIVLGIIAPIAAFIVFVVAMVPSLGQIS